MGEVKSLLKTLGTILIERADSRVSVSLNDRIIVFHCPHPSPNMDKGQLDIYEDFSKARGLHYDRIQGYIGVVDFDPEINLFIEL